MSPEYETQPIPERLIIDSLPEALGYQETDELAELGGRLVGQMMAGADTRELTVRYLELAEAAADNAQADNPESPRLGLDIRLAILRREGGQAESYRRSLEDAYVHALQMGLDEVAEALLDELGEAKAVNDKASDMQISIGSDV